MHPRPAQARPENLHAQLLKPTRKSTKAGAVQFVVRQRQQVLLAIAHADLQTNRLKAVEELDVRRQQPMQLLRPGGDLISREIDPLLEFDRLQELFGHTLDLEARTCRTIEVAVQDRIDPLTLLDIGDVIPPQRHQQCIPHRKPRLHQKLDRLLTDLRGVQCPRCPFAQQAHEVQQQLAAVQQQPRPFHQGQTGELVLRHLLQNRGLAPDHTVPIPHLQVHQGELRPMQALRSV